MNIMSAINEARRDFNEGKEGKTEGQNHLRKDIAYEDNSHIRQERERINNDCVRHLPHCEWVHERKHGGINLGEAVAIGGAILGAAYFLSKNSDKDSADSKPTSSTGDSTTGDKPIVVPTVATDGTTTTGKSDTTVAVKPNSDTTVVADAPIKTNSDATVAAKTDSATTKSTKTDSTKDSDGDDDPTDASSKKQKVDLKNPIASLIQNYITTKDLG